MKKTVLFIAILFSTFAFSQIKQDLGEFDRLKVSDRIELKLFHSDKNSIEISGDKAEEVKLITKNNQLTIRMETSQFLQGEDVVVVLYFKNLNEIMAARGATVSSEEVLKNSRLKFDASKGSNIALRVETDRLEVKVNSGAEIYLQGSADQQEVIANSGGSYDGEELKTRHTTVTVNAGGKADVHGDKTVEAKTRAGGEIHIWGNAEVHEKKIAGGTVKLHR